MRACARAASFGRFGILAVGDVAPRADDLERLAVLVADEMLLVAHPAIGPSFLRKRYSAVCRSLLEQQRLLGLDRYRCRRDARGPARTPRP